MKKSMKSFLLACFAFVFAFLVIPAAKTEAASVEQTGATQNSVTVAWADQSSSYRTILKYDVYLGVVDEDYNTTWTLIQTLPSTQLSCTISGLSAGTEYKVKVEYTYQTSYGSTYSSYVSLYDAKTLPGKVTNVKQSKWWYFIKQFEVTWDKQTGVDGYDYIVKTNSGKKKASGSTTYNSNYLDVTKISNTVVYTVQVRAYSTINGTKYYGEWSTKCYCFTQPRITSIKKSGSKLTIGWSKVKGATGYDVYMSTKKTSGYKKVKSVGKGTSKVTITKFKGKKLSSSKTYYFYIVTKKKVGSKTNKSGRLYYWNSKSSASSFGYF